MAHLRTDIADKLIKKIQQEFPDIDERRAQRLVRIFAEHMTGTGKRVRKELELKAALREALESRIAPRR
jgi:hypothetical protein